MSQSQKLCMKKGIDGQGGGVSIQMIFTYSFSQGILKTVQGTFCVKYGESWSELRISFL